MSGWVRLAPVIVIAAVWRAGCERELVEIENPKSGRTLSTAEGAELQRIADAAFEDARSRLDGMPRRITLIVTFGKNVIPEIGASTSAAYPGNVGLTLDPDRDVMLTIRTTVKPSLLHELYLLARYSRVSPTGGLRDRMISEGLATVFERDTAKTMLPWGEITPEVAEWGREILRLPETAEAAPWFKRREDGRRFVGVKVGTFLVDRASRASNRSAAQLVFASTNDVLSLAAFPPD